jgi:YVTN family beta-propeller protein
MFLNLLRKRVAALAPALAAAALAVFAADAAGARAGQPTAQTTAAGGAVLVLNKAENTLSIVDPETLKVVARVAVGEGPHEVVTSADGRTAYVSNYGTQSVLGSSISVIDIAARKELRRVDLGALKRPHGMAEVGGKIYFTSETSRAVGRLDLKTDKVDWVMGTGASVSHMLVVTPDGKKVFTANMLSDSVTALGVGAPPTPPGIAHIPTGKTPEGIGISPDGAEVWAANRNEGTVTIIDAATNKVRETIPKFSQLPFRVVFTPDGKRVLIPDPVAKELIVFDAATRKEAGRIRVEGDPLNAAVTPDNRRAYVTLGALNGVASVDLEKLSVIAKGETGQGPDGIAYAPAATPAQTTPGGAH